MISVTTAAATGTGDGAAPPDPRLKPAAHEFEACLMKEFLAPLQHEELFEEGKDGESGEDSSNALMSFGSEALAKAISDRGGFGIATSILAHFGAVGGSSPVSSDSGNS
jgi:peptidoglycan hydrolase FlgJ